MNPLFLYDLLSLSAISVIISVVYCLAKNHLRRPLGIEMVITFAKLVLGIVVCGLILLGLSHWL